MPAIEPVEPLAEASDTVVAHRLVSTVAGIDERLLLGGSLAHEKAHCWQAAAQA
jgi:hypothetical protein